MSWQKNKECDHCEGTVELRSDGEITWFECPKCGAKYHAIPPQGRYARGREIKDND